MRMTPTSCQVPVSTRGIMGLPRTHSCLRSCLGSQLMAVWLSDSRAGACTSLSLVGALLPASGDRT